MYNIYTDGSSLGNPGPSGWAVIVYNSQGDKVGSMSGGSAHSTNNAMELTALVKAVSWASRHGLEATIHTDSAYCMNGFNSWMHGWARNGWRNSKKEEVSNVELWKALYLIPSSGIKIAKVKAHAGILGNEEADSLAVVLANEYAINNM